jgi:hypothetical protein
VTWLQGRTVRFRLSPEGKLALSGTFEKDSFQALVEVVDDLGAWILIGRGANGRSSILQLLKWDYFATATVEVVPTDERPKLVVGFGK